MILYPESASARDVYQKLVEVVTPRPIAWVSTVDAQGRVNLAPYSFFNVFGSSPPVVVFSPGLKRDGSKKDTLNNIEATGEFVVNVAVETVAEAVNASSAEFPAGQSEAEHSGLTLAPSERVKPPRIAESPAHLECKLTQVLPVGTGNLVIGEVVLIHVEDSLLDPSGHVDPLRLRTIGRLGGDHYCRTSDLFSLGRPS